MRSGTGVETAAALLVGLVIVTLGSVLVDPGATQPDLRTSSYVNDPSGARGLHEILRTCGLRPERLVEPPSAIPDTHRTLVIAAPSEPFTDAQLDQLFDWVAAGGRAVVVAAAPAPPLRPSYHAPLLARVALRARRRSLGSHAASVLPDSGIDITAKIVWPAAQVLEDAPPATPDPRAGAPRTLIGTRSHRLAVALPYGDAGGEIVVLSDESLLTNRELREADNAVVVVELLTAREGDEGRILFDEFHHGFRPKGDRKGLFAQAAAMLVTTWPGRAILLLLGAWLVMLAGRGVRLGSALPDARLPRRRLSEHADALGMLLEKSGARAAALRILAAGTRRVVAPRAGLARTLSPRAFSERLAASPAHGATKLAELLDAAERLQASRDADVARTARDLAEARRDYLHGDVHRGN